MLLLFIKPSNADNMLWSTNNYTLEPSIFKLHHASIISYLIIIIYSIFFMSTLRPTRSKHMRSEIKLSKIRRKRIINRNIILWTNGYLTPYVLGSWVLHHCQPSYVKYLLFRQKHNKWKNTAFVRKRKRCRNCTSSHSHRKQKQHQ